MPSLSKPQVVLISDISAVDAVILLRAIGTYTPTVRAVMEVKDGTEAVQYLSGTGKYSDREEFPWPELLIMDMRMPRTTGIKVLRWLSANDVPNLKVAVLADSAFVHFRKEAFTVGLQRNFRKAASLAELVEMLREDETPEGPVENKVE